MKTNGGQFRAENILLTDTTQRSRRGDRGPTLDYFTSSSISLWIATSGTSRRRPTLTVPSRPNFARRRHEFRLTPIDAAASWSEIAKTGGGVERIVGTSRSDAGELHWRVTVPSCASWAVGVKVAQIPAIFALFGSIGAGSLFLLLSACANPRAVERRWMTREYCPCLVRKTLAISGCATGTQGE